MRRLLPIALLIAVTPACYASHVRDGDRPGADTGPPFPGMDGGVSPIDAFDPCIHPLGDMVLVLRDTFPYRIETTEVTRDAYQRFVSCGGPRGCMRHPTCRPASGDGQLPHSCVSPCEARAYCAWAGRRLCSHAEWQAACESTAAQVAPTGSVTSQRACVLGAYSDGSWDYSPRRDVAQPVRSAGDCHGSFPPFDEVFDVLGNVSELVVVDPTAVGPVALGFSYTAGPESPCALEGAPRTADEVAMDVGFRCCADE